MLDPFPGPPLKRLPQFGGEHEERLLWGTYRPGYYFGAWEGVVYQCCTCCGSAAAALPAATLL